VDRLKSWCCCQFSLFFVPNPPSLTTAEAGVDFCLSLSLSLLSLRSQTAAMAQDSDLVTVNQEQVIIPDLTIKDLLGAIPCVDVSPPSSNPSISPPSF